MAKSIPLFRPPSQGKLTRTDKPNRNVPQVHMLRGKGVNKGDTEGLHPRPPKMPGGAAIGVMPAAPGVNPDAIPSMALPPGPAMSVPSPRGPPLTPDTNSPSSQPAFDKGGIVGKSKVISSKNY